MFTIKILVFLSLTISLLAYQTCSSIQINGYEFDLSALLKQDILSVKNSTDISTVTINFCSAKFQCKGKKSFVQKTGSNNNTCQTLTNEKNPLKQNYTLIQNQNPRKGIVINYLPYYNQTEMTSFYTSINVFCSQLQLNFQQSCKYQTKNAQNFLICQIKSTAGCPKLKINYFWKFLSQKSIVFAILLWIISLFQLLFGYVTIRITIFIFGTLTGSIFGIIYNAQNYQDFIYQSQGYGVAVFVVCLAILMGILFGVSLLTMPKLGYMNIGLWVAVIFSLLLQNSIFYLTGTLTAFYITVGVVGLIMCIISLMAFKNYIIISTSFISAFWLVRPLGFFLSSYPNQFLSGQSYLINSDTQWQFYLYLASIIILTILGAVFQFCCFKKNKKGNQNYYFEQEGTFKQKIQKLLQFEEIKNFIKNGTQQLRFFKKLIIDNDDTSQQENNLQQIVHQRKNQKELDQNSNQGKRKKTKLQKQMSQFNTRQKNINILESKNQKLNLKKKDKTINQIQNKKRNKKSVQQVLLSSEQDEKKSQYQEEQSQVIHPNKKNKKFQFQYPILNKKK